ncbi:hypothetical protein DYI37_09445 [Fulvimarina endophytica]|uniref:Uncharacterized protein n=1 Tax=Fulvimarina endophytica TaxID=2293836 RepID=A0A371X5K9_9HYPH|nr:hypothetical protein [Fulvimarina endophytica]RFC64509.1 hypothetical protein DYI37_09445 [Fulvimarina endophytica]
MKTLEAPGLFLARFVGAASPFDRFDTIAAWAAGCGCRAVQVPSGAAGLMDRDRAATSKGCCGYRSSRAGEADASIRGSSAHMQGKLGAVHPARDAACGDVAGAGRDQAANRAMLGLEG